MVVTNFTVTPSLTQLFRVATQNIHCCSKLGSPQCTTRVATPYLLETKLMRQATGTSSESHLHKGFPFIGISFKKYQKIQRLIITPLFGEKSCWYRCKVGPMDHHNPSVCLYFRLIYFTRHFAMTISATLIVNLHPTNNHTNIATEKSTENANSKIPF